MTDTSEVENKLDYGEPLSLEDLLKIPIFQGVPRPLLEKNLGAVVLRHFEKGDVICREGDQGSTAFYLLKGQARVTINTPFSHVRTAPAFRSRLGILGFINKMTSFFSRHEEDPRPDDTVAYIPIDGPVDLPYNNPVAVLREGDLFGEMTCLSFYPRSATVVAEGPCELLEMLQNILTICQRNPEFKKKLDDLYRSRSLVSHLHSVPLFSTLSDDFLEGLKNQVELVSYEPGTKIFSEGDTADALYLVRIGFVKVTKAFPGGEMVLSYLPRGSYFGEIGLLTAEPGRRTASCTALDHVELVRIKAQDVAALMKRFPEIRKKLEETAEGRQKTNRYIMNVPRDVPLDDFLDQGLIQAQNLLILDLAKCTRCDACSEACAATHDGITRLIREGLRYENYLVATSCRQCMDPLCMVGCPVGSIRRKDSLEITIEDWCIGCGLCAKNCPYGNINMHPILAGGDPALPPSPPSVEPWFHRLLRKGTSLRSLFLEGGDPAAKVDDHKAKAVVRKKAVTCDLCTDLGEPACVYACPHDAAHRVDPKEFFRLRQTHADQSKS